jgi:aspartyl-tRNA(Asn)/glutamyl-tRNA(Gln) amidotransferase subunit C
VTISLEDVAKISKLSNVRLDDSEMKLMQTQLAGIFNWINQLAEIDISNVNLNDLPKSQMHERDDVITSFNQVKEVTQNAPQVAHDMFAVPKVVE